MNHEEPCRVLLVEDSRGDAMVIQALIGEASLRCGTRYHVDHVDSFAAALRALERAVLPYDATLLDLGLPDSDGIGSVGELCARFPHLAVVVMTALEDVDAAVDAVASGAQEYLAKGKVRPEELDRVLRHAILRRRMEQTLRESEAEHRALFECNPHPIWVCERDSLRVLAANEAATRQYGWSSEQFAALRLSDLTPTDQLPDLLDYLQGGDAQYSDRTWKHRTASNGQLLVQLASHALEFYAQPALLVMARNVTESARLAHSLSISERRFDVLFELSPGLLLEHDADGRILRVNSGLAAALGYLPESMAGLGLRQLAPTYGVQQFDSYLEALSIHGSFEGVLPLQGSDLRRRRLRVRSRRFELPGAKAHVLVVAEDVTDQVQSVGRGA